MEILGFKVNNAECWRDFRANLDGSGSGFLLDLARLRSRGYTVRSSKTIENLSVNDDVAKAVAMEGGITVLATLSRSPNRWVVEEATGGMWNLSVGEEHKGVIAEAGGIRALVDIIFKWTSVGEGFLYGRQDRRWRLDDVLYTA